MLARLRQPWSDRRAELTLGALACAVLLVIILMVVFVANEAWPTFKHNGLSWLGPGGNVDAQINKMVNSGADAPAEDYYVRAWPLVWGTILTTGMAVVFGLVFSVLAAIFIVELAPDRLRNVIVPVVRLLAAVPSVIYGLIGILVLVPFVGNHIINQGDKA
jgi:phosphate transport system permease protein